MNFKGITYLNRLKARTFQRTFPKPTEDDLQRAMRLNADLHALFDRFKPQDDSEKEQIARAFMTYQYLDDPKNETL